MFCWYRWYWVRRESLERQRTACYPLYWGAERCNWRLHWVKISWPTSRLHLWADMEKREGKGKNVSKTEPKRFIAGNMINVQRSDMWSCFSVSFSLRHRFYIVALYIIIVQKWIKICKFANIKKKKYSFFVKLTHIQCSLGLVVLSFNLHSYNDNYQVW